MRVAIIGTGISGLAAAHRLQDTADLTLFESASWVGGHSHTVDVTIDGTTTPVDTGFIVYNESTYPLLTQLFIDLGVETEPSNMSFAIAGGPVEYEGSVLGMAATPTSLFSVSHWRMIRDIVRFNRAIRETSITDPDMTLSQLIDSYSDAFRDRYLLPMGAAIWSTPESEMLNYPAATFARFLRNHGLVQVTNRPAWRTVTGGSRQYVAKLTAPFADRIHTNTPVTSVERVPGGFEIMTERGGETFDRVVFATHADITLRLLGSHATTAETSILSKFRYATSRAVLHTDPSFMPTNHRAWASWNVRPGTGTAAPTLSYWMNKLQNLNTSRPVFVTLNPPREPRDQHGSWLYDHPMFDKAAIAAQADLPGIQGVDGAFFCGAYARYGFHEDGLMSGYAAAEALLAERAPV